MSITSSTSPTFILFLPKEAQSLNLPARSLHFILFLGCPYTTSTRLSYTAPSSVSTRTRPGSIVFERELFRLSSYSGNVMLHNLLRTGSDRELLPKSPISTFR